jgi:hypothetical protein
MITNHSYIFIDESGDPGKLFRIDDGGTKVPTGASRYYILTALCIQSTQLFVLEDRIVETKSHFGFKEEIKSNRISPELQMALLKLLDDFKVRTYFRLIDKTTYKGTFAVDGNNKLKNIFDEYNIAKLVSRAVMSENMSDLEIIVDRADRRLFNGKFDRFNGYITEKINKGHIKRAKYVTHVDSQYVNVMQMSDLVSGAIKDDVINKNKELIKSLSQELLVRVV